MRSLQVNKYYYPVIGGVEKVAQDVSEGLTRLHDIETHVLACTEQGPEGWLDVRGIRTYQARSYRRVLGMPLAPGFFTAYRRMCREYDVVGFHMPFPLSAIAFSLMGSGRARVVVHYHCDIVRQKALGLFYHPFLHRLLSKADVVLASSPALIEGSPILRQHRAKCRPVPYAVNQEVAVRASSAQTDVIRQRLGIAPGRRVVLHVGRLVYYKGIDVLISAMRDVDATLVVVGEGPLRPQVEQQIVDLGMGDRVVLCGAVADADLPAHYEMADLFVLASTAVSEAYALVQVEAMAHGLPVINTSLSTSVPWVSQHDRTGLTVPPGDASALADAIQRILRDAALRERYAAAALVRAQDFAYERVIGQVAEAYRSTM